MTSLHINLFPIYSINDLKKVHFLFRSQKQRMEEQRTGLQAAEGEAEVVLPGFRFHPTDEELVGFYLRQKVEKKKPLSIDIIKQIDIYKHDPWDLAKQSGFGEKEWYFFSLRGRKYRNSIRPNRVTGSGFWKATGIDRPIYSCNPAGDCIGLKKSLVYYSGSAGKGIKTNWMMHEFRLPSCNEAESWTICRIFKRDVSLKKCAQQNLGVSRSMAGEGNSEAMAGGRVELQPGFANLNDDQIFREGNWDEIGRMVDYMMEPAITYDCLYF